ncbi:MAG: hypothetical protein JXO44_15520 [Clostridia bacterium]|nr:hypothetical protein [Clostridia bacterium]
MFEVAIDYSFSESESATLRARLLTITANPYTHYAQFDASVDNVLRSSDIPDSFVETCKHKRVAKSFDEPYVFLRNCPIDENLPLLDFSEPVIDKRNRKKTYVAEAFLLLYAKLMRQEPIGYINVNNGDIFQDIHPKRDLINSQSQKALIPIFFHKDLANHFVRPDWVNILGLRASLDNEVYTSFVRNKDILATLDEATCEVLKKPIFYTPFDDLTMHNSTIQLDKADVHQILGGATPTDIRFFENRTEGQTKEARMAVARLIEVIHLRKKRVLIQAGDLLGSANNDCLHNKEFGILRDHNALKERWLMKTVNVRSLHEHLSHFIDTRPRIVNG